MSGGPSMVLASCLATACVTCLLIASAAAAADSPGRPTPQQLWQAYPLDESRTTSTQTKPAQTKPAQTKPAQTKPAQTKRTQVTRPPDARARTVAPRRPAAAAARDGRAHTTFVYIASVAGALVVLGLVLSTFAFTSVGVGDGRRRKRRGRAKPPNADAKIIAPVAMRTASRGVAMEQQKVATAPTEVRRTKENVEHVALDHERAAHESETLRQKLGAAKPHETPADPELEILKAKLRAEPPQARAQHDVDALKLKSNGNDAAQAPALQPQERPAPPTPLSVARARLNDECSIQWWRGYVKSQFSATTAAGKTIASSPFFRWHRREAPPEQAPATDALRELAEHLRQDGWRETARGAQWFELRFTRAHVRRQRPQVHDKAPSVRRR